MVTTSLRLVWRSKLVLRIQETLQCDEFWFPGCTTSDTNANLFGDLQSCQKLADMCKGESWACYTFSEIATICLSRGCSGERIASSAKVCDFRELHADSTSDHAASTAVYDVATTSTSVASFDCTSSPNAWSSVWRRRNVWWRWRRRWWCS